MAALVRDTAEIEDEPLLRSVELPPKARHTHIHIPQRRARTADAAPVAHALRELDPADPGTGRQPPSAGWNVDFRREADGQWRGRDRAGRRYKLLVSHDGQTYRIRADEPGEDPRPMVDRRRRLGDALVDPDADLHDPETHMAALGGLQQRLNQHYSR